MLDIVVPGQDPLRITDLVLDYNGTLARDGEPLEGVVEALQELASSIRVHVVTADTFGKVRDRMNCVPCEIAVLSEARQDQGKLAYISALRREQTVCIGNGRNDRLMLKESALGIAVVLGEGAATETLLAADVVCTDIVAALDLLRHPLRLKATLRT